MKMYRTASTVLLMGLVLTMGTPTFATIIGTTSAQSPAGTFSVSATDLVNSDQATFTSLAASNPTTFGGQAVANANNGAKDYSGAANTTAGSFGSVDGGTYTFTLNTALNPLGYQLTGINILSGFDGRRISHNYTIDISLVGDPSFTELIRVPLVGTNNDSGNTSARFEIQTVISENVTGILATGVDQVRFTFRNDGVGGGSNETVFREIDIFGSPVTAPEPNVIALLGLGGLLLFRRRARR